jgi:hypothetical protein
MTLARAEAARSIRSAAERNSNYKSNKNRIKIE